ncbi:hypothetical protein Tco_1405507 [Tanacetum coccineum]
MSAKDSIATQTCKLSKEEFNDFLTLYPIPSEYCVILPKSNQTIFDAPPGFIYLGLTLLVVLSLPLLLPCAKLMVVSPLSTSLDGSLICVELLNGWHELFFYVQDSIIPSKYSQLLFEQNNLDSKSFKDKLPLNIEENPMFQHLGRYPMSVRVFPDPILYLAGLKPLKLDPASSTSCATRAKTSSSKDDVPYLIVSDDDKGLPDVLELKDTTACHLKISAITPPAWKNHLDNHMDVELLDLHDRCYVRQAVVDNGVNRRSCKLLKVIEKLRGEFDVMKDRERAREKVCEELQAKCKDAMTEFEKNPTVVALREKIYTLSTEFKEHKEVKELKQDRREVVSKVVLYAVLELVHSGDIGNLVGRLVSSSILYGRCRSYDQVADMKEPFNLSNLDEFVADPSAAIEALLSKKSPSLQRPAPSRTQVPLPSSQRATPSSVPISNPMSPPTDVSILKPQFSQLQ